MTDFQLAPGVEIDRTLPIKGGHQIHKRVRIEYAAWCAFCKTYVPESTEELTWQSADTNFNAGIAAVNRLSRHIYLAHREEQQGAET